MLFRALEYYSDAARAYRRGRLALVSGHLEISRVCAIRMREYAYHARQCGLDSHDYVRLIRASDALINACWSARQNLN